MEIKAQQEQVLQVNTPHLATSARGVALARQALATAKALAEQAEQAHQANLEAEIATLRAQLRQARLELHGLEVTEAIERVEVATQEILSEVGTGIEDLLEDLGHA